MYTYLQITTFLNQNLPPPQQKKKHTRMKNPDSPEYSSEAWSEINNFSPSLSDDDDDNHSWILISDEEKIPSFASLNLEEDSADDLDIKEAKSSSSSSSSSSWKETRDHKVTGLTTASSENMISALIRERVLHSLPAKQLLELRRVSHQWNDFITSPFFIHSQSQSSALISGVFYIHPSSSLSQPSFVPFDEDLHGVRSPDLRFLPEPVSILSSSRGLLCCKAFCEDTTKYFIVNPVTGSWVILPSPINEHGPKPAAVIVFDEPFVFNFSLDYKLVVAYDLGGCFGFEVFSSREWEWRVSGELCVTEWVMPESGVAAGGCAHWRTSMQTVVSYNPEVDRNWDVVWPESYRDDVVWELVEIDQKLGCVCVDNEEICVYVIEEGSGGGGGGGKWKEVRKMGRRWGSGEVRPVRSQEVKEVVVVENGRVLGRRLEDGSVREGDYFLGENCEAFVSFVGSLLHACGSWG